MELRNSPTTWGLIARLFHWIMALLILGQMALGWTARSVPLSPLKLNLFFWHKSFGILILVLALLRLAWRLSGRAPALPPGLPAWEQALARLSHGLLYTLMVAMPISGWIVNSAAKIPFKVFNLWPLPPLVAPDKAVEELAKHVHLTLFTLFAAVLLIHILAALRHHYVLHDDILIRMLRTRARHKPGAKARASAGWPLLVGLALLAPPGTGSAAPTIWQVDNAVSRLGFTATFEGNEFEGRFARLSARLAFDPDDLAHSTFDVTVDITSADTGSPDMNEAMADPAWFDFARHPQAHFVSSQIVHLGGTRYEVRGTLTVKGISRPVSLPFTWSRTGDHARIEGAATLRRTDFDIGEGEWASGEELGLAVKVWVKLALQAAG